MDKHHEIVSVTELYRRLQAAIQSDLNRHGAGIEFKHDPTCEECRSHLVKNLEYFYTFLSEFQIRPAIADQ